MNAFAHERCAGNNITIYAGHLSIGGRGCQCTRKYGGAFQFLGRKGQVWNAGDGG